MIIITQEQMSYITSQGVRETNTDPFITTMNIKALSFLWVNIHTVFLEKVKLLVLPKFTNHLI
jgi:hypothetical protein